MQKNCYINFQLYLRVTDGLSQKATKLTIFVDEEGNYIDEWFCDGVEYDYSGFDSQEFPRYTTATEKFFVIKYNGEIIVDRKMGL